MANNTNIHHISFFAGCVLTGLLLFLLSVNYKFSEPYTTRIQYSGGIGSGLGNNEIKIPVEIMLVNGVLGVNSKAGNFTKTCSSNDLEMFIGLSKSNLINFGYPAGSLVLNVGEKPSHSKYGKRVVFEINENDKIAKAYCY